MDSSKLRAHTVRHGLRAFAVLLAMTASCAAQQSPLTFQPAAPSLTYLRGSGVPGKVDVTISSALTPAPFFSVDTSTLPVWMTVDATYGTTPRTLRFTTTGACDALAPGTYTANIGFNVSGSGAQTLRITLQLNSKPPQLSVLEGTTRSLKWKVGTDLPTPIITAVSSDSPISYTSTSGGTLAPIVSAAQQSGLAFSFGTPINVSFNPQILAAVTPGTILTGTVTLNWGSPASTTVVTFNIQVMPLTTTLTGLVPAALPTAKSGQIFTVSMNGSGFLSGAPPLQKTNVGIVVGGAIVADANIAVNIATPSKIILTIKVPTVADPNLPFGAGGTILLGICNSDDNLCSKPDITLPLTVTDGPIIQAVTSASAFTAVVPPAFPSMAPYDMISIFGTNFCSSGGTGCSSTQILYGAPDANFRYPNTLSPDVAGATQRLMSVTFQTHNVTPVAIATAPLLFATNGQINVPVPAALSSYIGSSVDIVVNFGYGTGATMKSSAPFQVNITAINPGLFTVGANGQGDGAILNSGGLVTARNPVAMRSTDSEWVSLYMTGLGTPDEPSLNTGKWSDSCLSVSKYGTGQVDGTVIQSKLLNGKLPPCIAASSPNVPTVMIGGVPGTVLYAGFVGDTIAGLYQINVKLPTRTGTFTTSSGTTIANITQPVQLPVVVTANGVTSQAGVSMWVAPRLSVAPPGDAGLAGTVGTSWSQANNLVTAGQGTPPYRYALTSGSLPSGLTLNATYGAITGIPSAAGSYPVTVTATDSSSYPLQGTVSFTLVVR